MIRSVRNTTRAFCSDYKCLESPGKCHTHVYMEEKRSKRNSELKASNLLEEVMKLLLESVKLKKRKKVIRK